MYPLKYKETYCAPFECLPPPGLDLSTDLRFPHLNSLDYATHPLRNSEALQSTWDFVDKAGEHHFAIGVNGLMGRAHNGMIWGFEEIVEMTQEKVCYKWHCPALITGAQFVCENTLFLAMRNGQVQVLSIYPKARDSENPFRVFCVGDKHEHHRQITSMSLVKRDKNKAITGDAQGTLKMWDILSELTSTMTHKHAHYEHITCVDTSYQTPSVFATCSMDRSALLWDSRLLKPAGDIFRNHPVCFTAVAWAPPAFDPDENLLFLGDQVGMVHTVDKRRPYSFVNTTQYFEEAINKIYPNNKNLAVIANSNTIKVINADQKLIYENSDSQNLVRDGVWSDETELWTVGWEGKLRSHKIE